MRLPGRPVVRAPRTFTVGSARVFLSLPHPSVPGETGPHCCHRDSPVGPGPCLWAPGCLRLLLCSRGGRGLVSRGHVAPACVSRWCLQQVLTPALLYWSFSLASRLLAISFYGSLILFFWHFLSSHFPEVCRYDCLLPPAPGSCLWCPRPSVAPGRQRALLGLCSPAPLSRRVCTPVW